MHEATAVIASCSNNHIIRWNQLPQGFRIILFGIQFTYLQNKEVIYSHLSNKGGGWNKHGRGAKVAKSLNVEGGIFLKKLKVRQFQNEFMKSSFLPKYEQKIVKISALTKGQLISKCPFGVIVWTKIPMKFFPGLLP